MGARSGVTQLHITTPNSVPGTDAISWTCAALGGATCTATGNGNINDTLDLPPGSSVTYTVGAIPLTGTPISLRNTANVTLPPGVTDPTPSDLSSSVMLAVMGGIPALDERGVALSIALLALAGLWAVRRSA